MKTEIPEVSTDGDSIKINGKILTDVLDTPNAKLTRNDSLIERLFNIISENPSVSEAITWLDQQELGPIEQIIALQAVTGWPLWKVKPLFSHHE